MAHYLVKVSRKEFDVKVELSGESYSVIINGQNKSVVVESLGGSRMLLITDNHPAEIDIRSDGYDNRRQVLIKGTEIEAEIENYRLAQAKQVAGMFSTSTAIMNIKAPMPGLILEVKVKSGDKVHRHQPLVVIEAMKMENIIKSSADAVVKKVSVKPGRSVEKNDLLIEFE